MQVMKIAWFVSPHGFGHAARASAVMAAIQHLRPDVRFEIFTLVPEWFFREALEGGYGYHEQITDIGLVQKTALEEDLPATLQKLSTFLPFEGQPLDDLVRQVKGLGCSLLVSDISPLGIVVASRLGLLSILMENFTWDWIYEGYLDQAPGFRPYLAYLRTIFQSASFHIQTEPVCQPSPFASLQTAPVGRSPRSAGVEIRKRLKIPEQGTMILVTLGGVNTRLPFYRQLPHQPNVFFVIPGGSERFERQGNLILLPHHSDYYHPDLVHASDAIIGKAGYSTVAEAYWAGIPFAYISRPLFREAQFLADFIQEQLGGFEIDLAEIEQNDWFPRLLELAAHPRRSHTEPPGAEIAAQYICNF
jgi:hypothetical protein